VVIAVVKFVLIVDPVEPVPSVVFSDIVGYIVDTVDPSCVVYIDVVDETPTFGVVSDTTASVVCIDGVVADSVWVDSDDMLVEVTIELVVFCVVDVGIHSQHLELPI
jgi:hypothetical protein